MPSTDHFQQASTQELPCIQWLENEVSTQVFFRAFRIFRGQKMNSQPKKTFRVFGVFRGLKRNAQRKPDALQEVADCKSSLPIRVDSESRIMSAGSITGEMV